MKLLDYFTHSSVATRIDQLPFVIAEAGVNHEADINLAKRLIEEASEAGANAIKFQSYKASTIASKNSPAYWDTSKEPTKTQYELFSKYDKFWKTEFETLREYCESHEIEFLSTPFDSESAEFLSDMVNVFKISSSDITNKPFIEEICSYRKPVILSTGASNLEEIDDAVGWIDQCGVPVALLHCILNYPTLNQDANLGMILDLRNRYPDRLIGYSDHTLPGNMKSLEVATVLGARILEKHFTHDKSLPGNDHYHAMDKTDLKLFLASIVDVCELIGDSKKKSLEKESLARINARRSLVAKSTISRGSRIDKNQLTWKRPAIGISPKEIDTVVNRIAKKQIEEDEIITWDVLK